MQPTNMQPIKCIPLNANRTAVWSNGKERYAVHLVLDLTPVLSLWPDGQPAVAYERADGIKYAHTWQRNGNVLHIPLDYTDTAVSGLCKCMVSWLQDEGEARSVVYYGEVCETISTLGDKPTAPEQGIIEQVNAAAAKAEAAVVAVEAAIGPSMIVDDDGAGNVTVTLHGLAVTDDGAGNVTIS